MRTIDTLLMSLQAIRTNKLRSSLTLVGIVLGVASIIAVMTGISVIQDTMEKEMSVLGAQTFQVQKTAIRFLRRRRAAQGNAPAADDTRGCTGDPGSGPVGRYRRCRDLGLRLQGRVSGRRNQR